MMTPFLRKATLSPVTGFFTQLSTNKHCIVGTTAKIPHFETCLQPPSFLDIFPRFAPSAMRWLNLSWPNATQVVQFIYNVAGEPGLAKALSCKPAVVEVRNSTGIAMESLLYSPTPTPMNTTAEMANNVTNATVEVANNVTNATVGLASHLTNTTTELAHNATNATIGFFAVPSSNVSTPFDNVVEVLQTAKEFYTVDSYNYLRVLPILLLLTLFVFFFRRCFGQQPLARRLANLAVTALIPSAMSMGLLNHGAELYRHDFIVAACCMFPAYALVNTTVLVAIVVGLVNVFAAPFILLNNFVMRPVWRFVYQHFWQIVRTILLLVLSVFLYVFAFPDTLREGGGMVYAVAGCYRVLRATGVSVFWSSLTISNLKLWLGTCTERLLLRVTPHVKLWTDVFSTIAIWLRPQIKDFLKPLQLALTDPIAAWNASQAYTTEPFADRVGAWLAKQVDTVAQLTSSLIRTTFAWILDLDLAGATSEALGRALLYILDIDLAGATSEAIVYAIEHGVPNIWPATIVAGVAAEHLLVAAAHMVCSSHVKLAAVRDYITAPEQQQRVGDSLVWLIERGLDLIQFITMHVYRVLNFILHMIGGPSWSLRSIKQFLDDSSPYKGRFDQEAAGMYLGLGHVFFWRTADEWGWKSPYGSKLLLLLAGQVVPEWRTTVPAVVAVVPTSDDTVPPITATLPTGTTTVSAGATTVPGSTGSTTVRAGGKHEGSKNNDLSRWEEVTETPEQIISDRLFFEHQRHGKSDLITVKQPQTEREQQPQQSESKLQAKSAGSDVDEDSRPEPTRRRRPRPGPKPKSSGIVFRYDGDGVIRKFRTSSMPETQKSQGDSVARLLAQLRRLPVSRVPSTLNAAISWEDQEALLLALAKVELRSDLPEDEQERLRQRYTELEYNMFHKEWREKNEKKAEEKRTQRQAERDRAPKKVTLRLAVPHIEGIDSPVEPPNFLGANDRGLKLTRSALPADWSSSPGEPPIPPRSLIGVQHLDGSGSGTGAAFPTLFGATSKLARSNVPPPEWSSPAGEPPVLPRNLIGLLDLDSTGNGAGAAPPTLFGGNFKLARSDAPPPDWSSPAGEPPAPPQNLIDFQDPDVAGGESDSDSDIDSASDSGDEQSKGKGKQGCAPPPPPPGGDDDSDDEGDDPPGPKPDKGKGKALSGLGQFSAGSHQGAFTYTGAVRMPTWTNDNSKLHGNAQGVQDDALITEIHMVLLKHGSKRDARRIFIQCQRVFSAALKEAQVTILQDKVPGLARTRAEQHLHDAKNDLDLALGIATLQDRVPGLSRAKALQYLHEAKDNVELALVVAGTDQGKENEGIASSTTHYKKDDDPDSSGSSGGNGNQPAGNSARSGQSQSADSSNPPASSGQSSDTAPKPEDDTEREEAQRTEASRKPQEEEARQMAQLQAESGETQCLETAREAEEEEARGVSQTQQEPNSQPFQASVESEDTSASSSFALGRAEDWDTQTCKDDEAKARANESDRSNTDIDSGLAEWVDADLEKLRRQGAEEMERMLKEIKGQKSQAAPVQTVVEKAQDDAMDVDDGQQMEASNISAPSSASFAGPSTPVVQLPPFNVFSRGQQQHNTASMFSAGQHSQASNIFAPSNAAFADPSTSVVQPSPFGIFSGQQQPNTASMFSAGQQSQAPNIFAPSSAAFAGLSTSVVQPSSPFGIFSGGQQQVGTAGIFSAGQQSQAFNIFAPSSAACAIPAPPVVRPPPTNFFSGGQQQIDTVGMFSAQNSSDALGAKLDEASQVAASGTPKEEEEEEDEFELALIKEMEDQGMI
ncbi:hypothetical protein BDV96DRAFT_596533 [Lophiotrema nucula]|uniref:Uncharacterized protein n=1 Tax=Lophiotrema nucula TaxID=690887 RepID=A0A6A5ZHY7_9PLEO|nr:hypothetical protein BDV96DRAFT_596533 [Lophiotrema nucula]